MTKVKSRRVITKETPVAKIFRSKDGQLYLELQDEEPIKTSIGAIETFMRDNVILQEMEV